MQPTPPLEHVGSLDTNTPTARSPAVDHLVHSSTLLGVIGADGEGVEDGEDGVDGEDGDPPLAAMIAALQSTKFCDCVVTRDLQ